VVNDVTVMQRVESLSRHLSQIGRDFAHFRLLPRSRLFGKESVTKEDTGTLIRQRPLTLGGADEAILLKLDLPDHRLIELALDDRVLNVIGLGLILLGCDDLRKQRTTNGARRTVTDGDTITNHVDVETTTLASVVVQLLRLVVGVRFLLTAALRLVGDDGGRTCHQSVIMMTHRIIKVRQNNTHHDTTHLRGVYNMSCNTTPPQHITLTIARGFHAVRCRTFLSNSLES
jgi:hypothetical protein